MGYTTELGIAEDLTVVTVLAELNGRWRESTDLTEGLNGNVI